jgi:hypothetical protein
LETTSASRKYIKQYQPIRNTSDKLLESIEESNIATSQVPDQKFLHSRHCGLHRKPLYGVNTIC